MLFKVVDTESRKTYNKVKKVFTMVRGRKYYTKDFKKTLVEIYNSVYYVS